MLGVRVVSQKIGRLSIPDPKAHSNGVEPYILFLFDLTDLAVQWTTEG